jgi:putative DNA primase/helicase
MSDLEPPHETDLGNAERFARDHRADVRYVFPWSRWLVWDRCRWAADVTGEVMRRAKATVRGIYAEAAYADSKDTRARLAKHAADSEAERRIAAMLTLARSEPGIAITPAQLDVDPWLLNCPNGTLDLRTGQLRPHCRDDYLTKLTAAPYDPSARHETWDRYLEECLPDPDVRDWTQRFCGYALSGSTQEDTFSFANGPGGAGKTTLTESLARTWGDYGVVAPFSLFLVKKLSDAPQEYLAGLNGARLVTAVESRDGQRLSEGVLKQLTGGDTISADRKYEHVIQFVPVCKLLLASNFLPHANAADDGLWRRLRVVRFPVARPRREQQDVTIRKTLTDPAQAGAAILAWAVAGSAQWLKRGLTEPDGVMAATEAYRRSQEPLADFVKSDCVLGEGLRVTASALRESYEAYAKTSGIRHPLSGKAWGDALRARGCKLRSDGDARWWVGIDLSARATVSRARTSDRGRPADAC